MRFLLPTEIYSVMASSGQSKMLHLLLLLVTCWQLRPVSSSEGMVLTLGDVFPFGTGEGDQELPTGNNEMVNVPLGAPIPYFGEARSNIVVGQLLMNGTVV